MNRPAATALHALLLALALLALAPPVTAHEVRPAYLELRELGSDRFALLWKVPAQGDLRFGIGLALPARCAREAESIETWTGDAHVERATLTCPGGLAGETIAIPGLSATVIDVLVRIAHADGSAQVVRLTPSSPTFTVVATPSRLAVATTYVGLGIAHILFGVDHLLFVLALLILVGSTRRLVGTVTAFTVAHSLTLALATLGVVHVPAQPVEAVIALSIVFVAAEIVHGIAGRPGLTARKPWLVAFTFGLLHGLGFAGALAEVGLPPQAIPLALLCFNVGVELGQLAFIASVVAAMPVLRYLLQRPPAWASYLPPYAIGAVAA
jgi:hydrogenase/urease accessory protein HupE